MLLELEVKNFALVDHMVLEFGAGLTVLTGETGAGKSIILDSLSFLLGNSPKGVDSKAECRIGGRFQPTEQVREYLLAEGLPFEPEELLIVRERKSGGRTTSRLNGSLVSVSQLKELSGYLVDLHGQHQSYGLTRPSTHLPMLDKMAGDRHAKEFDHYRGLYSEYLSIQTQIREIKTAERERLREIEWLKLELEDISKVAPKPQEDEALEQEIKRLAASDDLARGSALSVAALGQGGGVLDRLNDAVAALSPLQAFDEYLAGPCERLRTAEIEVREVFRDLSEYVENIEHDPSVLDQLQDRAEAIKKLCRKYGPKVEDILEHQQVSSQKLERLENSEQILRDLVLAQDAQLAKLSQSADKLSKARRKAAGALGTELVSELSQLAMPKVAFQVEFQELDEFGPNGKENAQFLFSPNPGRAPTALSETASGGELSRVMLALVSILSRFQSQPTLIFDEIDVGLGGRTAEAVATKLARLAKKAQVLCVTHLPVVAAAGSGHLVVEKVSGRNSTRVTVQEVSNQDRVEELARMLSGGASKKQAFELAAELLNRRSPV